MDEWERLVREACSNAELMAKICRILRAPEHGPHDDLGPELRHYHFTDADVGPGPVRDYDPDVDGWPWEAGI